MPELHFAQTCTYTAPDGTTRVFAKGRHADVPGDIAENWFVKAHLMKDGDEPEVPATAPLQHEERVKMKAALDAAEGRARGAEAERDAAVARAEKAERELAEERRAHAKPATGSDSALEAAEGAGDAPAADGALAGPYTIARGHQGSYKVMKGEETIAEGLKKAEAETKVAELNTQG